MFTALSPSCKKIVTLPLYESILPHHSPSVVSAATGRTRPQHPLPPPRLCERSGVFPRVELAFHAAAGGIAGRTGSVGNGGPDICSHGIHPTPAPAARSTRPQHTRTLHREHAAHRFAHARHAHQRTLSFRRGSHNKRPHRPRLGQDGTHSRDRTHRHACRGVRRRTGVRAEF